jgi:serine/threonine-protein kinase
VRRQPADRRADVFSLGVVLYELLTDVKPFQGKTLKEITTAVLAHEPPLASKIDKTVPKALAEIAARAMAKDPEQRFRSARSFARELRQWLDANPVAPEAEATMPQAAPATPPSASTWRRPSFIAATALALVAGLAGGLWWQNTLATRSATVLSPALAKRSDARVSVQAPLAPPLPAALPAPAAAEPIVSAASAPSTAAADALLLATIVPTAMTPPTPAPVATKNDAPAAATRDPEATAPDGSVPAAKDSARNRRTREGREREARDREARLAAAALVAPPTGTVRVAISPWGLVEVDGAPSGAAPPLTELTLAEGRHKIVVRNGDFAPYVTSVDVTSGQVVSLRYKFGS